MQRQHQLQPRVSLGSNSSQHLRNHTRTLSRRQNRNIRQNRRIRKPSRDNLPSAGRKRMTAERLPPHSNTNSLPAVQISVRNTRSNHKPIKLNTEQRLQLRIRIPAGQTHHHPHTSQSRQHTRPLNNTGMKPGRVLKMMNLTQSTAITAVHPPPGGRTRRKHLKRTNRRRPILRLPHPPDRINRQQIKSRHRQPRRRLRKHHRRNRRLPRQPRIISQHQINMPPVERTPHPRRRSKNPPRLRPHSNHLSTQRISRPPRPGAGRGSSNGKPRRQEPAAGVESQAELHQPVAARSSHPPPRRGGEPPQKPPGLADAAHLPQLVQNPGGFRLGLPHPVGRPSGAEHRPGGGLRLPRRSRFPSAPAVDAPLRTPRPMHRPRPSDRHLGPVLQHQHRRRRVPQLSAQMLNQFLPQLRSGRGGHVEGGDREVVQSGSGRTEADPRVGVQLTAQPLEVGVVGPVFDPHRQIMHQTAEDALGGPEDVHRRRGAGLQGDRILRNREAPAAGAAAESVVGDQVGDLGPLELEAPHLGLAGGGARPLMPAESRPLGHQQTAPGVGPVSEFGVLRPPLGERLVEPPCFLEELLGDAQVASGHHPEQVVGGGCEVVGSLHVELDPLRVLRRPARPQLRQGTLPA